MSTHAGKLPRVLLFKGRGFISRCIRWQTRSQYSHAAILLPDGRVIEAWQGEGVRITTLKSWRDVEVFFVEGMTPAMWDKAVEFAKKQAGKGYDYWGALRFVSRRHLPENDRWFCSELVFAALVHAGVAPLRRIHAAEVSPGMLAVSPHLHSVAP